jgi:hypothetical protein
MRVQGGVRRRSKTQDLRCWFYTQVRPKSCFEDHTTYCASSQPPGHWYQITITTDILAISVGNEAASSGAPRVYWRNDFLEFVAAVEQLYPGVAAAIQVHDSGKH